MGVQNWGFYFWDPPRAPMNKAQESHLADFGASEFKTALTRCLSSDCRSWAFLWELGSGLQGCRELVGFFGVSDTMTTLEIWDCMRNLGVWEL